MPKFEYDGRMGRVRSIALGDDLKDGTFARAAHKYVCSDCGTPSLERSVHCPNKNCEKKRMCELKSIPDKHLDQARRGALRRARARI